MIIRAILILFVFSSCIESFQPEVDLDSSYVIVTGNISNDSPASIRIERSIAASIGNTSTSLESTSKIIGATVLLIGSNGTEEKLNDVGNGLYLGSSIGTSNVSYHVEILLPNSKRIISNEQLLKPGTEVGELFVEQTTRSEFIDGYVYVIDGLNLNLYLNESNIITKYYRWSLVGTYEFHSPSSSDICFITDFLTGNFSVGESLENDRDIISKRLAYLEYNGRKFSLGYSMEVSQFTLNKEAYDYWKKIDDQQKNVGSIFDSPPAQINGNLNYANDTERVVLGFFEANYVTKKRLFIKPADFREAPVLETSPCGFSNPPAWCWDCTTIVGSSRDKPNYWPY